MKIIKWEPTGELNHLFDDNLLSSFSALSKLGWNLAVDLYEENNNIIAKMILPGVKKEDLEISIEDDLLTISGSREEETETEKKDYYNKEIRRGLFSRSVNLPKSVDSSKAEAEYKEGVLVVTMPVLPGSQEKTVKIKIK